MFTILLIAALSLAACDATGAISIEDLTGATIGKAAESAITSPSDQTPDSSGSSMEDNSPSVNFKLTGMVEAVTANSITINGVTFSVDTTEDLTNYFEVGKAYEIEYTLNADDSISLVSFSLDSMNGSEDDSSEDDYKFYGMLEAVTENTLTFNGETFTVDTTEDLTTLFTAGEYYEIEYTMNADGTITLKSYSLDDSSMGGSGDMYSNSDNSYNNSSSYNDNNSSNDSSSLDGSNSDNENNNSNDSSNDSSNNSDNENDNEYDD
jgi:hypothetical protein